MSCPAPRRRVAWILGLLAGALVACRPVPADPLADFGGGFDPVRYDAGPLPPAAPDKPVRIAVPPFYADELVAGAVAALERYLEESCGFDVELSAYQAYDEDIAARVARGELDVAELSPYQYVDAMGAGVAIAPMAATVARGSASYGSYLVVKAGSPLHTLDDLRGGKRVRLGLVAPLSTSGWVLPLLYLKDHGVDLERDVELVATGGHATSLTALQDGRLDVAAVSSDLLIGNVGLAGPLSVLAKAGRTPNDVLVVRADLDPNVRRRLESALLRLSIHDPVGRAALRAFSAVDGFMPVPPDHYDEVFALAKRAAATAFPPARPLEGAAAASAAAP